MVDFRDYYDVLGVPRDADEKQIKKAYRQLARKFHPDVNTSPDASDRFKEINEAYQVLSDSEKRARYDRFGADYQRYQSAPGADAGNFAEWFTQQGGAGPAGQNVHFEYTTTGGSGFSDFFDLLFGQRGASSDGFSRGGFGNGGFGRAQPQAIRGQDFDQPVYLTLAEALHGTTRTFELKTADGTSKIEVTIPPGVKSGSKVRVAGKGGPGRNGGTPGDVYLVVNLKRDPVFEIDGSDLRAEVDVPLYTAILGGEVELKLPDGKRIALTIREGTQNGSVIRLRGQGWPKTVRGKDRGDLKVRVNVQLPTDLTPEERRLFEELNAIRSGEPVKV
jgi:DnaJ-class molecular chaperone